MRTLPRWSHLDNLVGQPLVLLLGDADVAKIDVVLLVRIEAGAYENDVWIETHYRRQYLQQLKATLNVQLYNILRCTQPRSRINTRPKHTAPEVDKHPDSDAEKRQRGAGVQLHVASACQKKLYMTGHQPPRS